MTQFCFNGIKLFVRSINYFRNTRIEDLLVIKLMSLLSYYRSKDTLLIMEHFLSISSIKNYNFKLKNQKYER